MKLSFVYVFPGENDFFFLNASYYIATVYFPVKNTKFSVL